MSLTGGTSKSRPTDRIIQEAVPDIHQYDENGFIKTIAGRGNEDVILSDHDRIVELEQLVAMLLALNGL